MKKKHLVYVFTLVSFYCFNQHNNYYNTDLGDDLGNNFIRPSGGQGAMGGEWFKKDDLDANLYKTRFMQYHSSAFLKAKLNFEKISGLFRYNMYRDEMEFTRDGKIYYLKKKAGTEVKFIDSINYGVYKNNNKLNYFKILEEGKVSLLIKESVILIKGKYARSSYEKDKLSKFEREKDKYFISFNHIEAIQIPKSKKKFYKLFQNSSKEMKSYINKNNLNIEDLNDLKKVILYYNSII